MTRIRAQLAELDGTTHPYDERNTQMTLHDAIVENYQKQAEERAKHAPFQPDPEMERLGARLDQLREDSPSEYASAGLARVRTQVTTYRRRKANPEQEDNR